MSDDVKRQQYDEYGERCFCCGCFLAEVDASTENGYDYELVCNNKRCNSNAKRGND